MYCIIRKSSYLCPRNQDKEVPKVKRKKLESKTKSRQKDIPSKGSPRHSTRKTHITTL